MKISSKWYLVIVMLLLSGALLSACGGSSSSTPQTNATSSVSGVASKGLLSGATVTAYSLNAAGVKGSALGSARTNANGSYSINLGSYTGSVILEASGGSYTDEATGSTTTNTVLLRAAVTNVSGNVTAAVTPYTEIAVQKAGTLTAANITAANTLVSNMIGGTDIITTMPANVLASSSSTTAAKNYGLALATISQMVSDGTASNVSNAISMIAADLADNTLNTTGAGISTSLDNFLASANNHSGLTSANTPATAAITAATGGTITNNWNINGAFKYIEQTSGFFYAGAVGASPADAYVYGTVGTLTFGGNGNATIAYSGNTLRMYRNSNTIITTPDSVSPAMGFTYAIASAGSVTFTWPDNSTANGWLSSDGNVLLQSMHSSITPYDVTQTVGIKSGNNMSNASLSGTYAMVSQSIGFHTFVGNSGTRTASNFYGDNQYLTLDGAGNATSSGSGWFYEMHHSTNTIGQNPETWSNWPDTYTVSSNGYISIPGGLYGGWVSADGNIFILGGTYVDGDIRATEQDIAVKLGTSMNNASLNGTFKLVMQSAGFFLSSSNSGTVAGSMVHTYGPDTMIFDGLGGCSWTTGGNDMEFDLTGNTISANPYPIGVTTACTYAVTDNGTTTVSIGGFNLTIWLSANGNYFIWGGGGWSNNSISGGAIPTLDGGPVWTEQAIGVKVQ